MYRNPGMKNTALTGTAVGGLAVALVLFFCDPTRIPIYPVCVFHQLTGLNCPGCGSLRALHALLHGHWRAAFHFNPLLVLSMPLFAGLAFRIAWNQSRGRPGPAIRPGWFWIYAAIVIAFGILRNLPASGFASLGL
jgi:hypothetical protein